MTSIMLSAASRPTLAKNARMGHPRSDMGRERLLTRVGHPPIPGQYPQNWNHVSDTIVTTQIDDFVTTDGKDFGIMGESHAGVHPGYRQFAPLGSNSLPFSVSVYLPFARGVGGYTYTYTHI